jgi:hypothetical protein
MVCAVACAPADPAARALPEALTPPAADGPPSSRGDLADPLSLRFLSTEHLGQLTSTATNAILPLGMRGTDLGSSFERDGAVWLLFGDTMAVDPAVADRDSVARAPLSMPGDGTMPALDWMKSGASFLPLDVSGVALGTMNVPVEGVAAGPLSYVFFSTGFDFATGTYTRSTLAHASGTNFGSLVLDHDVPTARFANVSVVTEGDDAFVFGSGAYRASAVYLARVPLASLGDRSAWRYLANGAYVEGEENGAPVVDASCVGELSVRRHPSLGVYMMTYACGEPRGVHLRLATSPAGPWTAPQVIFEPGAMGYQRFMHAKESAAGHDDGLSAPGVEEDWGGEYAPYLVPRWFTSGPVPGVFGIVYTLSSWNPYQVHLVRTWLGAPGIAFAPPARGAGLPKASLTNGSFEDGLAGWHATGDAFATFAGSDGRSRVTSFTPEKGDAAIGTLYQDFTVDASTSELAFLIHGGDGRVTLTRGADVVRSSRARRSNDVETSVVWNLEEYRGETLRVTIEDALSGPWGFVGAGDFVVR